jgi:hypothetical protein
VAVGETRQRSVSRRLKVVERQIDAQNFD